MQVYFLNTAISALIALRSNFSIKYYVGNFCNQERIH